MSAEGKEIVLNILGAGELFGEIALIDGKDRSADATVMENAELVVIDVRDFMPFLEERSELANRSATSPRKACASTSNCRSKISAI